MVAQSIAPLMVRFAAHGGLEIAPTHELVQPAAVESLELDAIELR